MIPLGALILQLVLLLAVVRAVRIFAVSLEDSEAE